MSFQVSTVALLPVLSRETLAAHCLFIDVESVRDTDGNETGEFALVLRSRDKAVIGKTDKPELCVHVFNDKTGAPVPMPIIVGDDKAELDSAAAQLIAFYSASPDTAIADRLALVTSDAAQSALPLAISIFGVRSRIEKIPNTEGKTRLRNGWKFGAWNDGAPTSFVRSAKDDEALAKAAQVLNNADAMKRAATDAIASNPALAGFAPDALMAMMQSVLATMGAK
jgi:hypothetical protein